MNETRKKDNERALFESPAGKTLKMDLGTDCNGLPPALR